jgi:hypothetical protein
MRIFDENGAGFRNAKFIDHDKLSGAIVFEKGVRRHVCNQFGHGQ